MSPEKFKEFCLISKREWTNKDGLLVLCYKGSILKARVCIGSYSNPDLVATNCRVWSETSQSKQLYFGPIKSVELQKVITRLGIDMLVFTTVKLWEHKKVIQMLGLKA